jgi:hypothetical protein
MFCSEAEAQQAGWTRKANRMNSTGKAGLDAFWVVVVVSVCFLLGVGAP